MNRLDPANRQALDVEAETLWTQALELRQAMSMQLEELNKLAGVDDRQDAIIASLRCLEDRAATIEQTAAYVSNQLDNQGEVHSLGG